MKTSVEWWNSVKADSNLLVTWLQNQYHGEAIAAVRIREYFGKFNLTPLAQIIIDKIATEEDLHAKWIGELLIARGITPAILNKEERYWQQVMSGLDTLEDVAAVGSHAERMRLERIEAIATDESAPEDIRAVFLKIWPMEVAHELLFEKLSSPEAMLKHKGNHEAGKEALGLVI